MNGRSRIETLEKRVLLAANPADQIPIQMIDGYPIATVAWQGQDVQMFAGRWVVALDGYSGSLVDQQRRAADAVQRTDPAFAVRQFIGDGLFLVEAPQQMKPAEVQARMARMPGYSHLVPDFRYELDATPNDPFFNNQWGLHNVGQFGGGFDVDIDAPEAWNIHTGNANVVVGIGDTGIDYNHPDLFRNIWINRGEIPATRLANLVDIDGDGIITFHDLQHPSNRGAFKANDINGDGRITATDLLAPMIKDGQGNDTGAGGWATGTDNDFNGYMDDLVGFNFFHNNNNPMDDSDHGTHVGGIAGAEGNNGVGISGVGWKLQLMALKLGSGNSISGAAGTAAMFYTNNLKTRLNNPVNIRAVNHSWGGPGFDPNMNFIIQQHNTAGIMTTASAGNNAGNNDVSPRYPASYPQPNVLAVANHTHQNQLDFDSNFGLNSVHLAAPGANILSTIRTATGSYASFWGTSMAAPFVAGAVGVLFSAVPSASLATIKNAIMQGVDPAPAFANTTISGGRLNLNNSLSLIAVPAALAAPDLMASSDTGISSSDNITANTTPRFQGISQFGHVIKLYANGVLVGQTNVPPTNIYTVQASTMADGVYDFTVTASNANGEGAHSPPLQVTIDTAPPVPTGVFRYHNSPHTYRVTWNENVTHAMNNDVFGVIDISTTAPVSHSISHDGSGHVTTVSFPGNPVLADGRYRLTVFATGPGGVVIDVAGNAMPANVPLDFLFMLGDANNDGVVNLADFNIVATHFGQSNRDYSEGDFDYNGTVNLADFNLLASRFGQSLPAAASSTNGASSPFGGSTRIGSGPGNGMSSDEDSVGELLA